MGGAVIVYYQHLARGVLNGSKCNGRYFVQLLLPCLASAVTCPPSTCYNSPRQAPSKTFDMLPEDFQYGILVLTIVGMSVATMGASMASKRKVVRP